MGLMRALQGVATGYLDARVGQFETAAKAKADKEALKDKYKAEETMRINVKNNELTKNAETKAIKDAEDKERRKQELISLGFTEEYLMSYGQYALGSDTNSQNFIKLGQDQYGIARWWDTPINFQHDGGNYKGMTVQEYKMSSGGGGFNSENVKKETKDKTNISDAVANNQIQTVQTDVEVPLYGKDLFFASPKRARSEGKTYINTNNGQTIHAYQYEEVIGKGKFGGNYYTTTYQEADDGDGGKILMPNISMVKDMSTFVPYDLSIAKQFNSFIDKTSQTSYLIRNPKTGLQERVTGQMTTYTNGTTPTEVLYGISPSLVDGFGIDLQEILMTPIEGTPFFTEETINKDFLVDKTKFNRAVFDVHGYELQSVSSTNSPSSVTSKDFDLTNSTKNTIRTNATSIAGFNSGEGKDFMTETIAGSGTITKVVGDTEASRTVTTFGSIIDDGLMYLKNKKVLSAQTGSVQGNIDESQGRFSFPPNVDAKEIFNFQQNYAINKDSTIASELGLDVNSGNVDEANFANRTAEYFKTIRVDLAENTLQKINSLNEEDFKQFAKDNGYGDTDEASVIASEITDRQLQKITTLDGLLKLGNDMKERQIVAQSNIESKKERTERSAVNKYFPPSEFEEANIFESFVDNYITDPDNTEQAEDFVTAINNLTSDVAERQSLIQQGIKYINNTRKEKYPFPEGDTDFQTRKSEREEISRKNLEEETGFKTKDDWLKSNTVEKMDDIGRKEWKEKYEKDTGLSLVTDYNKKTGLKKFVNSDLPIGHVEKKPRGAKQREWDRIWSQTHKPDGTPINASEPIKVGTDPAFNPADEIQFDLDVENLKSNSMSVENFNKKYGVGSAERLLNQGN
tara:strand:+ start:212 stop:2782 length:2571 start_codon:yes stop_codon:yes gene_type:complete